MLDPAFRGDLDTLKTICCTGLAEDFAQRLSRRGRDAPKLGWRLDKYERFPRSFTLTGARVVFDLAGQIPLPGKAQAAVRQTVVRIHSTQSITTPVKATATRSRTKAMPQQEQKPTTTTHQGIVEYLVMQQMILDGELGEWKVWGLTQETTPEMIKQDPHLMPGLSFQERNEVRSGGAS
jgi:protein MBA1